jgi:phospholipid/cholesterol/gamma-HCH transport system ATP-binding protein
VVGPRRTPRVEVFYADVGRLEASESSRAPRPARLLWPETPGDPPVVELTDVHKSFGRQQVLRGVNLRVPKGKITTLIGGSGSGKSVIMKHIIGLMRADAGEVRVFGTPLSTLGDAQLRAMRTTIGMVFQGAALLDALTIEENVAFPLLERGRRKKAALAEAQEVMEKLHLVDIAKRLPSEVSAGQRKRAGLARAIVTRPELIIYDEPTTGQDPVLCRTLDDMIVEAQSLFDVSSLVVSHDMPSAFRIADQIAMLHEGVIVAAEPPQGLGEVADPRVRRFIYAGTEAGRIAEAEIAASP